MDEFSRSAKYEYRANSNLVLEAERGKRTSEPSGEAASLWGRVAKMGDRVAAGRPAEIARKAEATKRRRTEPAPTATGLGETKRSRRAGRPGDLEGIESAGYRPKTRETLALWEQVLHEAQQALGDQPQEILGGAAEEVLAALKDDSLREPQKKARVESMLGPMADDVFGRLLQVSKGITDFTADGDVGGAGDGSGGGGLDEKIGVAVVFDDDDEEEDDEDRIDDQVHDEDEVDSDEGLSPSAPRHVCSLPSEPLFLK
jgi:pre-mRNA-splicing helicase BRR2